MDRAEKQEAIESLKGVFASSGVVVVSHYSGLSVAEMTALRARLRQADAGLKVVKNRLAKLALGERVADAAKGLFVGPVAIAFSADPVAAPKAALDYAKANDKFKVLGGVMGEAVLNAEQVKALASLPSLDELRAKLIGLIQAPATKVAGVLQAPAGQLARVLNAYATKNAA